jgi:hypothetical protein
VNRGGVLVLGVVGLAMAVTACAVALRPMSLELQTSSELIEMSSQGEVCGSNGQCGIRLGEPNFASASLHNTSASSEELTLEFGERQGPATGSTTELVVQVGRRRLLGPISGSRLAGQHRYLGVLKAGQSLSVSFTTLSTQGAPLRSVHNQTGARHSQPASTSEAKGRQRRGQRGPGESTPEADMVPSGAQGWLPVTFAAVEVPNG